MFSKDNKVILLLLLTVFSCIKDDIEVKETNYTDGGIGTSFNHGAIKFNFDIPNYYSYGYVRVKLHDSNNSVREVAGRGNRQVRFSNVKPGTYDYTLEFWAYNSFDGTSVQYNFNNGSLINVNSGSFVSYSDVFDRVISLNKTLEVRTRQTVLIDVELN